MHPSSLKNMAAFRDQYLAQAQGQPLKILDVGSTEINDCYRPLFERPQWEYIGIDLAPGRNVHIVLSHPYQWREIKTGSMDVVISGQMLEHAEYFWITALEMARVLKPGGLICLIAPSAGPEHRYPVDCWRFYPDGMRAIAKFAHLDCLEVKTAWDNFGDHESDMWHDTVAVMRKPQRSWLKTRLITLVQSLQRDLMCWRLR